MPLRFDGGSFSILGDQLEATVEEGALAFTVGMQNAKTNKRWLARPFKRTHDFDRA